MTDDRFDTINATGGTDPEVLQSAWEETITDMRAMAEARADSGWEALAIASGDTAPEHREVGDTDRFGMTFVVPDEKAREFEEMFRKGQYPKYEVYRSEIEGRVFLVVELLDPEKELAILVAGQYQLRNAPKMVHDAEEAGEMFTHFQTVDKTHLGTFRHDGHEKFVPHADRIDEFVADG